MLVPLTCCSSPSSMLYINCGGLLEKTPVIVIVAEVGVSSDTLREVGSLQSLSLRLRLFELLLLIVANDL